MLQTYGGEALGIKSEAVTVFDRSLAELADYMIKEYDNNPSLFNIQQNQNPITDSINFALKVRLLPYPNQSDTFETMCEEMEDKSYEIIESTITDDTTDDVKIRRLN